MCNGCSQHSRTDSWSKSIETPLFEFLINHIIKPRKQSLFQTWCESPAKKPWYSFIFVYLADCSMDTFVLMKVSQLKPGFNYAKWVGDYSTHNSSKWRMNKIHKWRLIGWLEISEAWEIDIAAKTSFGDRCDQSFVKTWVWILDIDVSWGQTHICEEIIGEYEILRG